MKPDRAQIMTHGLIAGFISYAAVLAFFAVINLLVGRSPFHTAAALGGTLFYGLNEPGQLVIEPGPVLAYNGVHLFLSLLAGIIAAWLLFEVEKHHFVWYFVLFIFLAGFLYSLLAIGIVGAEIAHVVPWWSVLAANLVWVASLGGYLFYQHRGLVSALAREQKTEA